MVPLQCLTWQCHLNQYTVTYLHQNYLYGFRLICLTQCGIGVGQPLYWTATPSVHPFQQSNSPCLTHQQPTNDVSYNVHHNIWHLETLSYWTRPQRSKLFAVIWSSKSSKAQSCNVFSHVVARFNITSYGCKIKDLTRLKN